MNLTTLKAATNGWLDFDGFKNVIALTSTDPHWRPESLLFRGSDDVEYKVQAATRRQIVATDGPEHTELANFLMFDLQSYAEEFNTIIVHNFSHSAPVLAPQLPRPGAISVMLDLDLYFMNAHFEPIRLTQKQKLEALACRFYQGMQWVPQKGDYYTTSRADLELYKIADVDDEHFYTTYLPEGRGLTQWRKDEFTEKGFGPKRVWVPRFVLGLE